MITVAFKALLSLQSTLAQRGIAYANERLKLPEGTSVGALVAINGFTAAEVEGVFLNGKIVSWDRELHNGDRVALVPPGIPGPHRFLLGIQKLP